MANLNTDGDSNTVGYNVPLASSYAVKLAAALGLSLVNQAVNGSMAADRAQANCAFAPVATDVYLLDVGTNDERKYGANSTYLGFYHRCLLADLLYKACATRPNPRDSSFALTGTWANTLANNIGKNATATGAKASRTVSGTAIYISAIMQNNGAAGGVAKVTIDGVLAGTIDTNGVGINTVNGLSYAPGVWRFGGLAAGPHLVEVEVTSSGKLFYLNDIFGNDQPPSPKIFVTNVIRQSAGGYAANGGSDTNVQTYNAEVAAVVSILQGDGFNVTPIDIWSAVNPATDLQGDGIHLSAASGHPNVEAACYAVMSGPPLPLVYAWPTNHSTTLTVTVTAGVANYVDA